jgi:hypothetical protein
MARIFRVECPHRSGPYRARCCVVRRDIGFDGHTPAPWNDGIGKAPWESSRTGYAGVFGFESRAQYEAWFSYRERRVLQERGYRLREYEGDIVARGRSQVLFMRSRIVAEFNCDAIPETETVEA